MSDMPETSTLAEVLASSLPALAREVRVGEPSAIRYRVTMPRLSPDDPDKSRKVAWASEHVRYSYVYQGLKYDSEAMAATFDINPGLCPDYDEVFHSETPKTHASREALMELAHVPHEIAEAVGRMEDVPAPVKDYADELRDQHARSALIVGGATATILAAWLAGEVPGALFVDYPSLLADLRARGRFGQEGAQAVANRLRDPALLILDRMDEARTEATSAELLHPSLRHRHTSGLPVIVTSSVPLEVMERRTLDGARTDEDKAAARRLFAEIAGGMGRSADERARHTITCGGK